MTARLRRVVAMLGVMGISVVGSPAVAGAGRATLYELTENMKIMKKHQRKNPVGHRVATSALTGVADLGTPLCPKPEFQSGIGCAVNVLGNDNVSLSDGYGTLSGHFATVIQGDNPVDGPETVALQGTFKGHMDFSPAMLHQIPYGTVVGEVRSQGGRSTEFKGVFRLPFVGNVEVPTSWGLMTLRQIFCPLSQDPQDRNALYDVVGSDGVRYEGPDLAYLDFDGSTPNGHCLNIQPNELSLGMPLVRFDIEF
jgi:hypothetical protein